MMSLKRSILLQPRLFPASRSSQASVTSEECWSFAIHDLAALADGNLSQDGLRRLAGHLRRCQTCTATLAAIVEDARATRGSEGNRLAAWLAAAVRGEDVQLAGSDEASKS
jgi:anti-sigma factor RsiW